MTDETQEPAHPTLPTPVRASLGEETSSTAADEAEHEEASRSPVEARIVADGRAWTVRVLGRSRGGPASAPVPLILLGYFPSAESDTPEREALVVGRSLADLAPAHLESAWAASSTPPRGEVRTKPIFPEIGRRGGKRDG